MGVLLHGLHLALVIGGAAAVSTLTGPSLSRSWRLRRVRAAARSGRLAELAAARADACGLFARVRRSPVVWTLLAYSFAIVVTTSCVLSARLAGAPWPSWTLVGSVGAIAWVLGAWLFAKRRRPRRVALATVGAQLALHPVVVVASQWELYRRAGSVTSEFASALFCHRVGHVPSSTQVADAAARAGLRVPASPVAAGGFLSPTATIGAVALLAAAGLFAQWLCLDRPSPTPA